MESKCDKPDDTTITIFVSSEVELAELMDRLETNRLTMSLAINKFMIKLMVIDLLATIQRSNLHQEYEAVDQFQYLGPFGNQCGQL